MIYQPGNEKPAEASVAYMPSKQPSTMADEPQIKQTRKILLIILRVCLAQSVIGSICAIFIPSSDFEKDYNQRSTQIFSTLISIFYYSFRLLVVHRYDTVGLIVLAWLGVFVLVIGAIVGVVLLFFLSGMLATVGQGGGIKNLATSIIVSLFIVTTGYIFALIALYMIVRFSYRLVTLIDTFKQSKNQKM